MSFLMRDNVLFDVRIDALGITQNELASRAGLSKSSMSKIRHRDQRVEHDVAERIAALLDVPVHALFEPGLPRHRRPADPAAVVARIYPRPRIWRKKPGPVKQESA